MAVRLVQSTHRESQGPFVIIEADDFDPTRHVLCDENGDPIGGAVPADADHDGPEIPDGWQSLHHNKKIAIAEKIAGEIVPADGETKTAAADRIIAAEVEKRAA